MRTPHLSNACEEVEDKVEARPITSPGNVDHTAGMRVLLKYAAPDEIPSSEDLFSGDSLKTYLDGLDDAPYSLIAVGDIMLGGRGKKAIREHGRNYPFAAILPLLQRASIVMGNLEGPLARTAQPEQRRYSYRVNPELASCLTSAGIRVVTLANNHLLDCGRAGVVETLQALARAGAKPLGAAVNERAAHQPVIEEVGPLRIGLLGYYWNRRCAATPDLPGSALDTPAVLESDIRALRKQVDRVVVTFHWGVPYERDPSPEDRAKARFAVDCGADAVVGHHPHIIQPFEIYRGCPIFYSVGNFAFGSGNSRAEGLLVAFRFENRKTTVHVYPVYVKNRDPRVAFQPKVLRGNTAKRELRRLAEISAPTGRLLKLEDTRGVLELPSPAEYHSEGQRPIGA